MTIDHIKEVQEQIQKCIANRVDISDGHNCKYKLEECSALLASAATCLVYAKGILLTQQKEVLAKIYGKTSEDPELKKILSPSIVKQFIEAHTIDAQMLYSECEENKKALIHCGDWLRTILSNIKQEQASANQQR